MAKYAKSYHAMVYIFTSSHIYQFRSIGVILSVHKFENDFIELKLLNMNKNEIKLWWFLKL